MLNNYDKIARHYDLLSRMLFYNAQTKAQTEQLSYIPANSRILIVGGGTGWILEEITKIHHENLTITYVEISAAMIRLARQRNTGKNKIEFIHGAIEEFTSSASYDVIHSAFLFDNFARERTEMVFFKLNRLLTTGGLWLFSDFSYQPKTDEKWKGVLLKIMYAFFKKVSKVEATVLTDTSSYFESSGYEKLRESTYYRKFIKAIVYKKESGCIKNGHVMPAHIVLA